MRRHADVGPAALAERMQRHIDPAAAVVEAEPLGHGAEKRPLLLHRKAAEETGPRLHRRRDDLAHQRHQFHLQFGEERPDGLRSHARVVPVDQVVVRRRGLAEIGGLLFGQLEMAGDEGRVAGEVRVALAFRPRVKRLAAVTGFFADKLRRELGDAIVVAAAVFEDHALVRGQLIRFCRSHRAGRNRWARRDILRTARPACTLQLSQQLPHPRITGGRVLEFGHERELLAPEVRAVRRQVDLFVPAQQAVDRAEDMGALESRNEFGVGRFCCHAAIEANWRAFASAFAPPAPSAAGPGRRSRRAGT